MSVTTSRLPLPAKHKQSRPNVWKNENTQFVAVHNSPINADSVTRNNIRAKPVKCICDRMYHAAELLQDI